MTYTWFFYGPGIQKQTGKAGDPDPQVQPGLNEPAEPDGEKRVSDKAVSRRVFLFFSGKYPLLFLCMTRVL